MKALQLETRVDRVNVLLSRIYKMYFNSYVIENKFPGRNSTKTFDIFFIHKTYQFLKGKYIDET